MSTLAALEEPIRQEASTALERLRTMLSVEKAWTKCAFARDATGHPTDAHSREAVCWCLNGAIDRAVFGTRHVDDLFPPLMTRRKTAVRDYLSRRVSAAVRRAGIAYVTTPIIVYGNPANIQLFNDDYTTTFEGLRRMLADVNL